MQAPPAPKATPKDCILCGCCLEVCPLFAATGREELSPKAKLFLAQSLTAQEGAAEKDGRGLEAKPAAALAGLCLGCDRCRQACAQGLSGRDAVVALRAVHPDFQSWLWKQWITKSDALWPAFAGLGGVLRRLPSAEKDWGRWARALAALAGTRRPAAWLRVARFDVNAAVGRRFALFPGCLARTVRQEWSEKARRIVVGLGGELAPELDFGCCGQTLDGAGQREAAQEAQRSNVAAWRATGRPDLVVFCATCAHGLAGYATSPAGGIDWAEGAQWRAALTPLASLWGETQFQIKPDAPANVLYHRPCHRTEPDADFLWLRRALQERLRRWTDQECCGLGGVLQLAAPDLSAAVGARCLERLAPEAGDVILTSCSGCVTQLAALGPAGVAVGHWLDVVATD